MCQDAPPGGASQHVTDVRPCGRSVFTAGVAAAVGVDGCASAAAAAAAAYVAVAAAADAAVAVAISADVAVAISAVATVAVAASADIVGEGRPQDGLSVSVSKPERGGAKNTNGEEKGRGRRETSER